MATMRHTRQSAAVQVEQIRRFDATLAKVATSIALAVLVLTAIVVVA